MKNVAVINSCTVRSTGKIAVGLHKYLIKMGYNSLMCYGRPDIDEQPEFYKIDSKWEVYMHALRSRITGFQGGYSKSATRRLIKRLRNHKTDTIFIISLHTYYINEEMLFDYLSEDKVNVIYVMIDEYAYLGRCPYNIGCEKYKTGCGNCPFRYCFSMFGDSSAKIWKIKKAAYQGVKGRAIFVGPEFVINESKKSPLMEGVKTAVVDEAVDVQFYHPVDTTSLKKELGISDKQIVITHIAPMSQPAKGGSDFIKIAKAFENNKRYAFVHVGYDVKNKSGLPDNYIAIGYVTNQNKLVSLYSLGDLMIFPSIQDTMSNACLETLSSGTPLLCYDISGMPYIGDKSVMTLVEAGNIEAMIEVVKTINSKTQDQINTCRNYALARYDNRKYFDKLIEAANII